MRRIGVLVALAADDPQSQRQLTAFVQGLQELRWTEGRNIRIEIRWAAGDTELARKYAMELVALAPDIIVASGGMVMAALLQATRTIPIVFTLTPDPVGAGFVGSLAQPGGNATGFTGFEYGITAKWLELLKEIAPRVTRAVVLRDATIPQGIGQFAVLQASASSIGVELRPIDALDVDQIERLVQIFANAANGGMVVTASGSAIVHRERIIALAARHKLPTVYFSRFFVNAGGLISYGADSLEPHRSAASYVDRILKGEKPADLPVQAAVKYELAINLKTAKALGLIVPDKLLTIADEVIE
jgi:putative ABC transport system substrate-binding protein